MISILIPVYNYNVGKLVKTLHQQAVLLSIEFEVLVCDDAGEKYLEENKIIERLSHCHYFRNNENLGRAATRNKLYSKARFQYCLFLDGDVMPQEHNFLFKYFQAIQDKKKLVFGGLAYHSEKPPTEKLLRWKYGKKIEAVPAKVRNKKPFRLFLVSNTLLYKPLFEGKTIFDERIDQYGYEDLAFLLLVKKKGIPVFHIDNPVFHLNLETSRHFLEKTKTAMENLCRLEEQRILPQQSTPISHYYSLLKKAGMTSFLCWIYKRSHSFLERQLCSERPRLFFFDVFKLLYFSYIKK